MPDIVSDQTLQNDRAYKSMSMELEDSGHAALFHDGALIDRYGDEEQAYMDGCNRFGLGNFSIIVIGRQHIIHVGALVVSFVSHTCDARTAEKNELGTTSCVSLPEGATR